MKNIKNNFIEKSLLVISVFCSLILIEKPGCAASRANVSSAVTSAVRKSTATTNSNTATTNTVATTTEQSSDAVESVESNSFVNKSNQFDSLLSSSTTSSSDSNSTLADRIRQQRASFAAQDASAAASSKLSIAMGGKNACDSGLRKCMVELCGKDLTKCALDGDTIFGDKLNKCRRDLDCTGEEFRLFTTEIKEDRDLNVRLSSYNSVIDCGVEYNNCILDECGNTFNKCLGKSAADRAIQRCKMVADQCREQDSGLATRFGTVIGKLRETAEIDVKKDEERMYALRDLMRNACSGIGAMFDERSFDCVYTVSFYAGDNKQTPMASRKQYAGSTFTCTQEWFGIDVTTFKENAYRETRSQKAASSAFLGAGLGTAVGTIASGAMGRALERQKAEKELEEAKKGQPAKEEEAKTDEENKSAEDAAGADAEKNEKQNEEQSKEDEKNGKAGLDTTVEEQEKAKKEAEEKAKKESENKDTCRYKDLKRKACCKAGTTTEWKNGTCSCVDSTKEWNGSNCIAKKVAPKPEPKKEQTQPAQQPKQKADDDVKKTELFLPLENDFYSDSVKAKPY